MNFFFDDVGFYCKTRDKRNIKSYGKMDRKSAFSSHLAHASSIEHLESFPAGHADRPEKITPLVMLDRTIVEIPYQRMKVMRNKHSGCDTYGSYKD